MEARHWLLMLGSNLADDACVRAAIKRLQALGELELLTPIGRFAADGERGGAYFNVLVALACVGERTSLDATLKRYEAELGRRRDGGGEVAIDIDILAARDALHWRADEHALAKGEFARVTVRQLLHQAGVDVTSA